MAQLSHMARMEVERARSDIEALRKKIGNFDSFLPHFGLSIYTGHFDRIAGDINQLERSSVELVDRIFGPNTPETKNIVGRLAIGDLPSGLDRDGIKRHMERNIAVGKDALEDAIRLLEHKIQVTIGTLAEAKTATPSVSPPDQRDKKKDWWQFKPKIPFTGIELDLREIWRRLRD